MLEKSEIRHILVHRGCYKIITFPASDPDTPRVRATDPCYSRHTTLSPSQLITKYEPIDENYAEKVQPYFFAEKYVAPKTGSNKAARQRAVVTFCDDRGYSASKCTRVENAAEWLLSVLKTGDKTGLDMTDIYWRKNDAENSLKADHKDFDYEELAYAIEFLLEEKLIYKLGVSSVKYVHYMVSSLFCLGFCLAFAKFLTKFEKNILNSSFMLKSVLILVL